MLSCTMCFQGLESSTFFNSFFLHNSAMKYIRLVGVRKNSRDTTNEPQSAATILDISYKSRNMWNVKSRFGEYMRNHCSPCLETTRFIKNCKELWNIFTELDRTISSGSKLYTEMRPNNERRIVSNLLPVFRYSTRTREVRRRCRSDRRRLVGSQTRMNSEKACGPCCKTVR